MKPAPHLRLYLIGTVILMAGLVAAIAIFQTASDERADVIRYEVIDGVAYPVFASESKSYRSDLERFGGKAAVFADDFNRWFAGLWMGKQLAYTVVVLSLGLALAFFWAGHHRSKRPSAKLDGGKP